MILLHSLLFLSSCFSVATAQWGPAEFCFRACETSLGTVQFNATNPRTGQTCTPKTCGCLTEIATASLYLCTRLFCSEKDAKHGIDVFNATCLWTTNVTAPPFSIVDQYSDEDVLTFRRLGREDAFPTIRPVVSEVVLPDPIFFKMCWATLDAAYFETYTHIVYGIFMYLFWFVVIVIGLTSHFAKYIADQEQKWQRIPGTDPGSESSTSKSNSHLFRTPYTLLKRYITVPATFGYIRSQNVGWWATIPTRIQSITIGAFIILNVVLCSASYRVFQDNMYWRDVSAQLWRYVADRTGIISTANLPLIWIFGIRNNTLMWLTGWDFATYNNFHRWVARVATVEAVVHSVAYTYMIVQDGLTWTSMWGLFDDYLEKKYFWNGVLATVFMCLICGFSIYGIRRYCYETFLLIHIGLSVGVLVTMWYHVEIFSGFYNWFLYPCFSIWIFDRCSRVIRILLFNLRFWSTKALTTYNHDSNIVRVTIPYSSSFIKPRPGTFYYISSLNSLQIWESHPFTLSYSTPISPSNHELSQRTTHSSHGTMSPPYPFPSPTQESPISYSTSYESETLLKSSPVPPSSTLTFLIRPYNGFTSRLRNSALQSPSTHRILLDGPYGETQPLHRFTNVLFIVGGAGIAVPLSYLDLLLNNEDSKTESLKIVWAVREEEFLNECLEVDFRGLVGDERLAICAFVTAALEDGGLGRKGVKVQRGRPDVVQEIEEAAEEAGFDGGLAVVACGPGKMADDSRRAVVRLLGRGYGKVEYFEESFNW